MLQWLCPHDRIYYRRGCAESTFPRRARLDVPWDKHALKYFLTDQQGGFNLIRGCLGVFGKFVFFPFQKGLLEICCAKWRKTSGFFAYPPFHVQIFLLVSQMWIWGASKWAHKENIKSLLHLHRNINVSSLRTYACVTGTRRCGTNKAGGVFFFGLADIVFCTVCYSESVVGFGLSKLW